MKCPNCQHELEPCGAVTFGLHDGTLFRCPSCRMEYATADNDGSLLCITPLYKPVQMDDIKSEDAPE